MCIVICHTEIQNLYSHPHLALPFLSLLVPFMFVLILLYLFLSSVDSARWYSQLRCPVFPQPTGRHMIQLGQLGISSCESEY